MHRRIKCSALRGVQAALGLLLLSLCFAPIVQARTLETSPPQSPVKLIFIHHSCGENWLNDGNGNLGRRLGENNYFVSDTNYGWGPASIGDRTDIVDWPEWFTSSKSETFLQALLGEDGKRSAYSRPVADPGGKNRIIMFKSCFPNSNISGSPDDPPKRGRGLTVANAKAIYNELLEFFSTKPDILFIAVTAPPVQDDSHAGNARAFNNWLVHDWLSHYRGSNVGVFDFYNVLTGPDNHHRVRGKHLEHVVHKGADTLYYPSNGDNHPSPAGNRKATRELLPLLNLYYHSWQQGKTYKAPKKKVLTGGSRERTARQKAPARSEKPEDKAATTPAPPVQSGVIADFEAGCSQWTTFQDQAEGTRLAYACQGETTYAGEASLHVEYRVEPESWGTCSLVFPSPRSWEESAGVTLHIRAEKPGQRLALVVYEGVSPDDLRHFEYHIRTTRKMTTSWQRLGIRWDQLRPPPWEGSPQDRIDLKRVQGVALAFNAEADGSERGSVWVDEIALIHKSP